MSSGTSYADILSASGPKSDLSGYVEGLSRAELERSLAHWPIYCRQDQRPPGDRRRTRPWTGWLVLGGRGAGKTRTGAEWVRGIVAREPGFATKPVGRIALVGETHAAVRDVMVEGPSGLLAIHDPRSRPTWSPSLRRLEWANGAVAHAFSSEDPDGLRGPQFGAAWGDEIAKWRHPEETWDTLQFALRLGLFPREVMTTTPRPIPLLRRLIADPAVAVTRATTRQNAKHLAPVFLDAIVGRYAGTRMGRQELDGEFIEERQDALWTRDRVEACRASAAPELVRVVVAVDPPASSGAGADSCGIVAAGIDEAGLGFVLADATVQGLPPGGWAAHAVSCYHRWGADALIVEANQGGEMVEAVLRQVDAGVPVRRVHAARGKYPASRAGRRSLREGEGPARRGLPVSRGRDGGFRADRPVLRTLSRPGRRPRLGPDRADAAAAGRAAHPRVVSR
jgi:phage terminase large subunit-like protein